MSELKSNPHPVVLCGQTETVAHSVITGLKEHGFAVIHMILTKEAGVAELPSVLSASRDPKDPSACQLGSKNYTQPPIAVVVGGAYSDDAIEEMCEATAKYSVPWLRPDMNAPNMPSPRDEPRQYGERMVERVVAGLNGVLESSKGNKDNGVSWY